MFRPRGPREPTDDVRKYRRQTDHRLLVAVILVFLVGGLGLIGLIYGPVAVLTATPFIVVGVASIVVLFVVLAILEKCVGDD
jgi:hypothetical protein